MMVIHHLESLEEFEVSVTNFSNIVARITEYDTDIPLYNSPENGIYAIDEGNQIIHRLYTENMIPQHRRYNSVLFKIMQDAVAMDRRRLKLERRLEKGLSSSTKAEYGNITGKYKISISEHTLLEGQDVVKYKFIAKLPCPSPIKS